MQKGRYWRGFPVLPGAVPVLGHLPTLMFDAVGALRRGCETLGPVFWVRFGMRNPVLFCADSESFELLKHKSVTMKGAFEGLERMIASLASPEIWMSGASRIANLRCSYGQFRSICRAVRDGEVRRRPTSPTSRRCSV